MRRTPSEIEQIDESASRYHHTCGEKGTTHSCLKNLRNDGHFRNGSFDGQRHGSIAGWEAVDEAYNGASVEGVYSETASSCERAREGRRAFL